QRVGGVARLVEVAGCERVGVDHHGGALRQVAQVRLQRGRVHRHQHVGGVTRGQDVVVGEVELEAGDPGNGAGRGADLGWEVGECGKVVSVFGGFAGEPVAGELHAVAGVTREADGDAIQS